VVGFELDGAEVAEGGGPSPGVVPGFHPGGDSLGQLVSAVPDSPVEQLGLQAGEEGLGHGIVEGVADGSHGAEQAGFAEPLAERPGGVLAAVIRMMDGLAGLGRLRQVAASKASQTSSARRWSAMDRPTTRRDQASMTTAAYTLPSRVGCSVMSATHSRSGPSGWKRRWTRSSAGTSAGLRRVQPRFRRLMPTRLAWRISRSTRLRLTRIPAPSRRSAHMRGEP
jgi:hypothetical protein